MSSIFYKTYENTIEEFVVVEKTETAMLFEIFNENFNPPLSKLIDNLLE